MRDCLKNLQVRIIVCALICPSGYLPSESDNTVISRFVDSLTVRIQSARERSKHLNDSAHQTQVRWCWVSEIGQEGRPHYHFVLRLNKDALSISTREYIQPSSSCMGECAGNSCRRYQWLGAYP